MGVEITTSTSVIAKLIKFEFVVDNFTEIFQKCSNTDKIIFNFDVIINSETTKWQLSLYPKGNMEKNKEYMSLFLKYLSGTSNTYINAEMYIANSDKDSFKHYQLYQIGYSFGFPTFVQHRCIFDNKEKVLSEDKLTVCCTMFLDKTKSYSDKIRNGKIENFDDFAMLLRNNELSDVTIIFETGHKKMSAHSYILAKKSSVFEAMFKHDMLESKNKQVNITDISNKAIKNMIRFIYTGALRLGEVSVELDVLKAADKYDINNLKEMCEERISKKLSIENCFEILQAAQQFNADKLKDKAIEFIAKNADVLIEKPEFELLKTMHAEVASDIVREMALGMKNQTELISLSGKRAIKRRRN